ncbi:MAG: hypothetical protein ABJL35_03635, partial [Parasphingorhabdus sp.]|uniref:hypothetical protein n=1 Tax=Parasphingorhabdus sp. TaxID=2709688 RepID=UPI003297E6CB
MKADSCQENGPQLAHDAVTSSSSASSAINDNLPTGDGRFHQGDMGPLLLELRSSSHRGLSDDELQARDQAKWF